MLSDKEIEDIREELATAKNPLFIYDGDGDGLTSFLLLYKIHREGKGMALTTTSYLDGKFVRKVEEINPDKIFILDIPVVEQDFLDGVKRPVIWIDHHPPLERTKVKYFNPRIRNIDAYVPTSRMSWQVSQHPEDMWIAAVGSLADYSLPNFIDEFQAKHPSFAEKGDDINTLLYKRQIGKLVKFFFFLLKGPSTEVRKSIKILTRIKTPEEIFNEETPQGKFLHRRFLKINEKYEELLKQAKKCVKKTRLVLFNYTESKWSFTTNLSNELFGHYPEKMIIISRRKSEEVKCSLRGKNVRSILEKALVGVEGRGGGHPDACGAVIKEKDWDLFLTHFNEALDDS
ncbi:DHH family phosphoesterase [Candidatus Woesearchaeota archaeon]|nr:DHH family phosphoesterase [Candidatus Woesearchaeota archaeon]